MSDDASQLEVPEPTEEPVRPSIRTALVSLVRGLPAWANENRFRAGLTLVGSAVVTTALLASMSALARMASRQTFGVSIETAIGSLDAGAYEFARKEAQELRENGLVAPEDLGGPTFVLGAAAAYEAEPMWDKQSRDVFYQVAARYLEESQNRGFPPGREAEGTYLLAVSLYESGRYPQAVVALREAMKMNPDRATEIHQMLAQSYFRDANPNFDKALAWNRKYMADKTLPLDAREAGVLMESRIHFRRGEIEQCRGLLEKIPESSKLRSDAIIMFGRIVMAEGDRLATDEQRIADGTATAQANEKYEQAVRLFGEAEAWASLDNPIKSKSAYLTGLCLKRLKQFKAARMKLSRARQIYHNTPEGWAATLEEADVLRSLGLDDEAIGAYRNVLEQVPDPATFSNPWVTLDEFRRRMSAVSREYESAGKYKHSLALTELLVPLFPLSKQLEMEAEGYRNWAGHLAAQADGVENGEAERLQTEARTLLRKAGRIYARLSRLRLASREYPDDVWNSGHCYLQGRDYTHAVRMLKEYLKGGMHLERRPEALVGLGQAYLALNELDESLAALDDCVISHGKHPASYVARIHAARAHVEKGNASSAKEVLLANLRNNALTPRSVEWEESLFALGGVLYVEGARLETKSRAAGIDGDPNHPGFKEGLKEMERAATAFGQAIQRLSEAVERYPDSPETIESYYRIAQSHRQRARLYEIKLRTATIEASRVALNKDFQREMRGALQAYETLQRRLIEKTDSVRLTEIENTLLRNAFFGQGMVLFDLGRFDEAIRAYSTATNRYQHDPVALEAFVQIADCYRRLDRPIEARGTIEQARVVLGRIPPDADFTRTTRYDRKEWDEVLQWLAML